ncbi:site-specific DNA-methyltransferase [Leptothrix discophora]|uniref:site-specific DNA-methyltransferase (adenine-specific) n=1 Tax=Leptothrix discophora TaxID=89 RepID=A0ABT9G5T3_LEPDI|nr:site-specific DNA-methyltransferase [Leptothrix discophora]MDP4301850.1 site-specific DNA-methyltransferase [Leptothrix discophora]
MGQARLDKLEGILLDLLPVDGSNLGNGQLQTRWITAAAAAGEDVTEADFTALREDLVARGKVVKGRGRGGSTGRAAAAAPDAAAFDLQSVQPDDEEAAEPTLAASRKARSTAPRPRVADEGDAQVLSYRHTDRRKNNPEVGLVSEASDPQQPKQAWAYNPHLDPVLNFDSSRAELENQVADALASGDPAVMKAALEEIQRRGAPYLQWAGKAERTRFEVDTVSLHVHERIDPMSILSAVRQGGPGEKNAKPARDQDQARMRQASLFEAPFEALPLRDAVDFYRHDKGWANRLVSGDSLQVMNSLLVKEGMAGQVQMVYIDPPYGIKYGSNFQPFVGKRDVKDKSDADLTQEPEMIKAFRDTWELGIHSYLSYLRDRLLAARELLAESGSLFVQISDENLHHVREIMDEVFGPDNFVSVVVVQKTGGQTSELLSNIADYLVWFAKDKSSLKYRQIYLDKVSGQGHGSGERYNLSDRDGRAYRWSPLVSNRPPGSFDVQFQGKPWGPSGGYWKTGEVGFSRLIMSGRISGGKKTLQYKRMLEDFPAYEISNVWSDVAGTSDKVYVVQTALAVLQRCILMCTDPGDIVLDPTCGSGTTAVVAEKWGRRWITCDTSRVAVTLAKQRLMTASFDYYELAYPHEGLKGGFIYKTVQHVTLKSIANNADIDAIYERLHPGIEEALSRLNLALDKHPPLELMLVTEGVRKGQKLKLGKAGVALHEWEVPFPGDDGALPLGWPAELREPFEAFHAARQRMQAEMDRSIAANADNETLYDQPEKSRTKLRITGPFTVEAVPFPTVLGLEAAEGGQASDGTTPTEDQAWQNSIARSGESHRQQQWRDELLKTGIRGKGGQKLEFSELEVMAGTTCLHATGTLAETGERVVVSFGPEHGALEQRQVEHALNEAGELFPRPKMIVFCAFTFDPEAAKDIDALKGITALKAQMNTDLLTEDLKKARSSNQSFWLMGQPDVALTQTADGLWRVEVNGFDYFDTVQGELISGGKGKIAMWSLDTDYDGRSLFPHQVFFPMAGKDEGWKKLKKTIRAELDESLLDQFHGTVSLPFEAGKHGKAAVKIVDDRGIESLKILPLVKGAA